MGAFACFVRAELLATVFCSYLFCSHVITQSYWLNALTDILDENVACSCMGPDEYFLRRLVR